MNQTFLLLLILVVSGCTTVKIVDASRQVTFVKAGQSITATNDSVLMPVGLYRQYRQIVANEIERLESR